MSELVFYVNGKFVPEKDAKISVLDLGLVRGYGVFDFLRTYQGKPFALKEHLQRLINSANIIGLKIPWKISELEKIVLETLKKNKLKEANIKIVATGGVSPDQITPSKNPTLCVLIYPPALYPSASYTKGVKVVTVPWERSFSGSKSTNYIPAILALKKANKKKAVEALYLTPVKEVLEGTTTNFFVIKNNILVTPKNGVLMGITREIVLKLAKKVVKIKEGPIKYSELSKVDEAFITASNKEIMPVVEIDNIKIGNGKVGNNTQKIIKLFREYTERVSLRSPRQV